MVHAAAAQRRFPTFNPTDAQRQGPAFAQPRPRKLEHALTSTQLDAFWRDGFIALPGLFTADEAARFAAEAQRIYDDPAADPDNQRYDFATVGEGDDAQRVLWKIDPFHDLSPVFGDMVRDRRLCDALASIYDGREPRLFKDKLIYKPPHTHGNGLHQDYNWWQGYPTSLISVTIAIDPATEANGCTVVYPGYQQGLLTEPGQFKYMTDDMVDPEAGVKNLTQPGDVLMFHCFAPHSAGPNTTDAMRRQVFLTYNDSADGEMYFSHGEHYRWYVAKNLPEDRKAALYFR